VFPPGGVRVRAIPCDDFCIADGVERCGIRPCHLEDRRRAQRAPNRRRTGLFDIMKAHFAEI
jgi:5-carboxymethyl-2-hydroxymuconate isomerase